MWIKIAVFLLGEILSLLFSDRLALLAMLSNVFRACITSYDIGSLRGYVKKIQETSHDSICMLSFNCIYDTKSKYCIIQSLS